MCLITKTTYTDCIHTSQYTDRHQNHAGKYFRGDPEKCENVQVNEVKVTGLCKKCLAKGGK